MNKPSEVPRRPRKDDRDTQQRSADQAPPQESRDQLTRGGGHRSGSRGAGTLELTEEDRQPRRGPNQRVH
jgi:hypothetical protein